jgi:hypothetical protein
MRLTNAAAERKIEIELEQGEQEQDRERAKKNAIGVKNSTLSKSSPEVKITSGSVRLLPGFGELVLLRS